MSSMYPAEGRDVNNSCQLKAALPRGVIHIPPVAPPPDPVLRMPPGYADTAVALLLDAFLDDVAVVAVELPGRDGTYPCPAVLPTSGPERWQLVAAHVTGGVSDVTTQSRRLGRRVHLGLRPVRLAAYNPGPGSGLSTWLCFDLDCAGGATPHTHALADGAAALRALAHACAACGLVSHAERSGGGTGLHLWLLLSHPTATAATREAALHVYDRAFADSPLAFGLVGGGFADPRRNLGLEVFPKARGTVRLGNPVWLPFSGTKLASTGGGAFLDLDTLEPVWPMRLQRCQ